jgi:hypothetical protein
MIRRSTAWVLLLTMTALSCSRGAEHAPAAAAANPPATAPASPSGSTPARGITPSDAVAAGDQKDPLAALAADPKLQRYDLPDTHGSVTAAFMFVRDRIRYEVYPGVLRGARGAFLTGAANAFDRSVLLAELLARDGVRTRFARGTLPADAAHRLFLHMFDGGAAAAPALATDEISTRVRRRADHDFALVRGALAGAALPPGGPAEADLLPELRDHVWIQAWQNDAWIDLDSAFGDAAPGHAFAAVETTSDRLPENSFQRVTIRVAAETLSDGALTRHVALEKTVAAEALLDRQIYLFHAPAADGGGLAGAIGGAVSPKLVPVLWIAGHAEAGSPIAFPEQDAATSRTGPPRGGLSGLFGSGGALHGGSQFVAEWLEFDIALPGGRHEITRRTLVDRGGEMWRQTTPLDATRLRPLERVGGAVAAARAIHNIWFTAGRHDIRAFVRALSGARTLARAQAAGLDPATLSFAQRVWPFALSNFALLVRSDHLMLAEMNRSASERFYADSPRIIIMSTGPDASAPGTAYLECDLRRDHVRGVSRSGRVSAARKIYFGVLEGALEHETGVAMATAIGGTAQLVSTSAAFEGAAGAQRWSPASPQTPAGEWTARAGAAVASGRLLVAPAHPGSIPAWWEIATEQADTRAVYGADLNAFRVSRAPYRSPGTSPSTTVHELPESYSPDEVRKILGDIKRSPDGISLPPEEEAAPKKKSAGNEYLMVVGLTTAMVAATLIGEWLLFTGFDYAFDAINAVISSGGL